MIQKDDENDITFGDLLGDPDMDDLNAMMSDLFQQAGIDVDMDNFAERLRISLPVNYAVWAGFLEEILEWPIDNYNEDAEFLEPFAYTMVTKYRYTPRHYLMRQVMPMILWRNIYSRKLK